MHATLGLVRQRKRAHARERSRLGAILAYCQRNPQLVAGIVMVGALVLVGPVGAHVIDVKRAQPLSDIPSMPPGMGQPLGSDDQGRDLFAVLVAGVPLTLEVGFVAGAIGLGIGTLLGLISGFVGGVVDAIIRMAVDALLTVPALLVLIIIA